LRSSGELVIRRLVVVASPLKTPRRSLVGTGQLGRLQPIFFSLSVDWAAAYHKPRADFNAKFAPATRESGAARGRSACLRHNGDRRSAGVGAARRASGDDSPVGGVSRSRRRTRAGRRQNCSAEDENVLADAQCSSTSLARPVGGGQRASVTRRATRASARASACRPAADAWS